MHIDVICCNKTVLSVFFRPPNVPEFSSVLRHESAHGCKIDAFLHCPLKEFYILWKQPAFDWFHLIPSRKTNLLYFVYIERILNERTTSGKTVNLAVAYWTASAAHGNTSLAPIQNKSFSVTGHVFRGKYWDTTTPGFCLMSSDVTICDWAVTMKHIHTGGKKTTSLLIWRHHSFPG